MNGKFLLDTNVVLYILAHQMDLDKALSQDGEIFISVITELELLSYPKMLKKEELDIKRFLALVEIVDLSHAIKEKTIAIKRTTAIKLPDAIICATAIVKEAVLVTNDKELLKVAGIKVIPFEGY